MTLQSFYYPLKIGRILLCGMEEVMGSHGLDALLRLASLEQYIQNYPSSSAERSFAFETVSKLMVTLEQAYGPRGGRGLALRSGRACFSYGLKEYGAVTGLTETAFRMLPLPIKISTGIKAIAELFNKQTDQRVRVEEKEGKIHWVIERCPMCWERTAGEPVCHLAVGMLQETLYWLSGGKVFDVKEITCIAQRDAACTILIDPIPFS